MDAATSSSHPNARIARLQHLYESAAASVTSDTQSDFTQLMDSIDRPHPLAKTAPPSLLEESRPAAVEPDALVRWWRDCFPLEEVALALGWKESEWGGREFAIGRFLLLFLTDLNQRYQYPHSPKALRKRLVQSRAQRLDVGGVSRLQRPRSCDDYAHELVFDFDATCPHVDRRFQRTAPCDECWGRVIENASFVTHSLREQIGCSHIFWFYSGGRGVHVVCTDETTRYMQKEQRAAVIESVIKGARPKPETFEYDAPVSESLNHLFKMPYSIHPHSSRVCVCIRDPRAFCRESVPEWYRVSSLEDLLTQFPIGTVAESELLGFNLPQ